jgi:cytochrome c-type biogenesis protein CcmH
MTANFVFVLASVLGMGLVLLVLLRPFLWKASRAQISHRQLNTVIYRDQVSRLEQDLAQGVLAQQDHAQALAELQRRVLEDTQPADAAATLRSPVRTIWAIALVLPLAAVSLYLLIGSPAGLTESGGRTPGETAADVERMVAGLAQRLEKEPDNLKGWAMLARSYKVMGRSVEAEKAFDKAATFIEGDAQMLANYADAAAANAGGSFAGKPAMLIQKALKADPDNAMALWLAGTAALRNQDYDKALAIWERLATQLPPGLEDAQMLQGAIDEARAKGGKSAAKAAPPAAVVAAAPAAAAPGGPGVSGTVELDPALKGKAAPGDTLMVIARVPGTRMPVAVLRQRAQDLPLKFTLDDSLSMSPQARISAAHEVEIEARVSKSGMAKAEPGDLISTVQTVKVGARGVTLRVAQIRP